MKVTKYFVSPMNVIHMGPHTSECTIFKGLVVCLLPLIRKRGPILFVLNTHFTKQRGYGARNFFNVYVTHHILEHINTLQVQLANTRYQNLNAPSLVVYYTKLAASASCTFTKFIFYKFPSRAAMASSMQDFTMHWFRLNWIFNPYDTSLLTKKKFAYNLGTLSAFFI